MKLERSWVVLTAVMLLAALAGCSDEDGRGKAKASAWGTDANGPGGLESLIERIARERRWVADKAMEEAREFVEERNRELARINGKVFLREHEFKRVVVFAHEPGSQRRRDQREKSEEDNDDGVWEDGRGYESTLVAEPSVHNQPQKPPEDAVVKQWSDRVAEAQSIEARLELGEVMEVNRGGSLDVAFEAVVGGKAVWTHRRALAKEIHPIPHPPEGRTNWRPEYISGGGLFFGHGRSSVLPLPKLSGAVRDPNSDLQRKAMEAWKHAEPESGVIPIRLRVIFGARPGEIGVRVLIEDGGKWEPADIVWPEFGGVPWKTGLPEDADHVLRPGHHVALPQRVSGSR